MLSDALFCAEEPAGGSRSSSATAGGGGGAEDLELDSVGLLSRDQHTQCSYELQKLVAARTCVQHCTCAQSW